MTPAQIRALMDGASSGNSPSTPAEMVGTLSDLRELAMMRGGGG